MKSIILITSLFMLMSCGKSADTGHSAIKKEKINYSLTPLKEKGVYFAEAENKVKILCEANGVSTNEERIEELENLQNFMQAEGAKIAEYHFGKVALMDYEIVSLVQWAIIELKYSDNPLLCPKQILASSR